MTEPTPRGRYNVLDRFVDIIIIIVGIVAFVYFLVDDTPADWLVRAAYAGALTAGIAVVLYAIARET